MCKISYNMCYMHENTVDLRLCMFIYIKFYVHKIYSYVSMAVFDFFVTEFLNCAMTIPINYLVRQKRHVKLQCCFNTVSAASQLPATLSYLHNGTGSPDLSRPIDPRVQVGRPEHGYLFGQDTSSRYQTSYR